MVFTVVDHSTTVKLMLAECPQGSNQYLQIRSVCALGIGIRALLTSMMSGVLSNKATACATDSSVDSPCLDGCVRITYSLTLLHDSFTCEDGKNHRTAHVVCVQDKTAV